MPLGVSPPSYSRSPFAAPDPDTAAPDIAANDSCRSESADVDVDGDGGESLHSSGTAPCSSSAASTEGSGGLGIGFGNGLGTTAEGRSKTTMAPVGSDDDDSHSASSSSDVEGSSSYRMNDGVNGDGRSGAAPASEIENDGEGTDSKFRTIQMGGLNVMVMAPPDPDSPVAAAPNTAATTSATTTATAAATATADDMENAPSSPLPPEPKEPKAGPPVVTPAKPAASSDYGPPSSSRRQSRAASLLRSSASSVAHRRSKSKNSYNLTPARDGLPSHNRSLSTPLTSSESGALVLVGQGEESAAKKAPGEYGPSVRASSVRLSSAAPLSSSSSSHRHSRTRSYGGRGSGTDKSRRDSAVPDDIDVSSGLTPLRASYGHGLPLGSSQRGGTRPGEQQPDPNAGALVPVDGDGVDDSLALTTSSRTTCRVENESTSVYMSMTTSSDRGGGGGGGDLLTESLRSSLGGSLRKSSRSSSSSLEPRMGGAARHPRRPAEFGGSGGGDSLTLTPSRPGGNYATVASAGAERVVEDGGKDVFLSLKNGGVGDGNEEEEEDDVLQTPGSAASTLTASTPGWGSLRYRRPDHVHSPSSSSSHRKSAFENRLVLYEEDKQQQDEDDDGEELVGDYGVPLSRRQSSARKSSNRKSSSKRRSTGASKKASTKKTKAKSGGRHVVDGDDEEGSFADKQHREQRGMVDLVRVGSGKGLGAAAPPTPPTLDDGDEDDEDEEEVVPPRNALPAVPEALAPPDLDIKDSEEKEDEAEAKKTGSKGRRGSLGGKKKSSATKMLLKAMSAPARSFRKKGSSSGHHRSSSSGGGAVPSSPLRKIQSSMSWGSSSATPSSPAPSPRSSTLPPTTSSSSSTPSKELADAILREVREQEHDDLAAASPGGGSLTKDVLTEPVMAERAQRNRQRGGGGGGAPQDRPPARGDSALGDLASDSLEETPYEDGDGSESDNESEGEYHGRRNSASDRFAAAASGGVETPPSTPTHPRHRKSQQTTSPSDARSIASGKSTPSVRLSISEKGAVEAELGTELAIELYQPPPIERVPTDELETESEAEEDEEELLRKHRARRSHVGISRPSYRSAFDDDGGRALEDAKKVKSRRKKRGGDSERALVVRDPNDRALAVVPSGSDDSDDDSYDSDYDSEGSDGYLSESEERIGISRPSYDPAGGAEDEEEERPASSSSSALAVSSSSRALVLHKSATKHKRASGASFTIRDEAKQASRLADVLASPLHGYMTGLSPQSLKNRQLSGVSRTVHRHTSEGRYDARDALTPSQGGRAKGRHWSGPDGADRNLLSRGYSVDSLARRGETVREWGGVRVYSLGAEEGHGQRMHAPPPALPAPHPSPMHGGGGGGLGASGGASSYASPFAPKRSSSTPGGDQPWALTVGAAASGKKGRAGQDVGNNMRSAPPALMGTPAPKQFAEEIVDDSDDSDYEQDDNGSIPESVTAHHGVAPRSEPPQAMNTPSAVLMSMSYHTPSASSSLVKRNSPARASSMSEAHRPPPLDDSNYGALVPFAANSASSTPTKPTVSSPRPAVTFKIFVLLLNPSLKIFELIQVVYDPSTATVGDVLDLVPQNATEPLLGRQRHVGLVRPGKHATDSDYENAEMTDLDMLASGIPGNDEYGGGNYASAKIQRGEILVAIPSGFDGRIIAGAAAPILRNKQVARLLGRADPLSPKNIEDDRREMERHAEEQEEEARAAQDEEASRSGGGQRQRSQRREGSGRAVENGGGGERRRERRKRGGATEPNGDSGLMAKLTAGEEI